MKNLEVRKKGLKITKILKEKTFGKFN